MDTDSPPNRTGEGSDEEEESSYNADLLELEPLREDSEDLLDDGNDIDNDDAASEQQNTDDEKQDGEREESSSGSSGEDEDEDDAHVQGLTSNEREILTLLAVDKVDHPYLEQLHFFIDSRLLSRNWPPSWNSQQVHYQHFGLQTQRMTLSKSQLVNQVYQTINLLPSRLKRPLNILRLPPRNTIKL